MAGPSDSPPRRRDWRRHDPWLVLALLAVAAVWHAVDFPDDADAEFPRVARPTFSPLPPPAYRLAEPGDTIDRVAIYVSSLAVVLALAGLGSDRDGRRPWLAALGVAVAAFWYASNPSPTFDGWHGLGWPTLVHPEAPPALRAALAFSAALLVAIVAWGLRNTTVSAFHRDGRTRDVAGLLALAVVLTLARLFDVPRVEPAGYWPRCAFVGALVAFSSALLRNMPRRVGKTRRRLASLAIGVGVAAAWSVLVAAGIALTWYHRPLERLRTVVPGKIYMSAMPTGRGLEIAQARRHFKTIINLFPENTPLRSPKLPQELSFVQRHGLRYVGSPGDVKSSDDFLDLTLRLARDPDAWPILVHCHGCMDRTPAWVGIYQFVVEGRPLDDVFRFIEGHRGFRPKASVILLYNRVLPRLAPERYRNDPASALLRRCAEGTTDPFYEQLQIERAGAANPAGASRVGDGSATAAADRRPSLTPRP